MIRRRAVIGGLLLWAGSAVFSPVTRGQGVHGWQFPVSGAYSDGSKWTPKPDGGGGPPAGAAVVFNASGSYTVTCDGAAARLAEIVDAVTFQLSAGGFAAGECVVSSAVRLQGVGTFSGGPFSVRGSIEIDGATLEMNGLDFPVIATTPKIHAINGGKIRTTGAVTRLNKPLLEGGSEWTHSGSLNMGWCFINGGSLVQADELVVTPAELAGGRLKAGHLVASGITAAGATIESDTVALTGANQTSLSAASRWKVAGDFQSTVALITVTDASVVSAGSLSGLGGDFEVQGPGSELVVAGTVGSGQSVGVKAGGRGSAARLIEAGMTASDAGSEIVFAELAEDTAATITNGGMVRGGGLRAPMTAAKEARAYLSVSDPGSSLLLSGNLEWGVAGQAFMQIKQGAAVQCALGLLDGGRAGGVTTGAVSGQNSLWRSTLGMIVGDQNGQAVLNVSSGGRLETGGLSAVIGAEATGDGLVYINGGGLATPSAWDGRLTPLGGIGVGGKGFLSVTNRGRALFQAAVLGSAAGSDGRLELSGTGTSLEVARDLTVGAEGWGRMAVSSGATATAKSVLVGNAGAANELKVTRAGAGMVISGALKVGNAGMGTLTIDQGAGVTLTGTLDPDNGTGECGIGFEPGSVGTLTVDGAGSSLLGSKAGLIVGVEGTGTLNLKNGGTAVFDTLGIGAGVNAQGTVLIDGAGSSLTLADNATIGGSGASNSGEVTISAGAALSVGPRLMVTQRGLLRLSGGGANVGQVTGAPVPGTLKIGSFGTLQLGGRVIGAVSIGPGGRLVPGASPGLATIEGALTLEPGTVTEFEIGGTDSGRAHDHIEATGPVALGGTAVVSFRDGFAPSVGQTFDLVRASAVTGAFQVVEIRGLGAGFAYALDTLAGGTLRLTVTAPAPATTTPPLAIERIGASLRVSWPDYVTGWVLESSSSLAPASWQLVVTTDNQVTVPAVGSGFYRLKRP